MLGYKGRTGREGFWLAMLLMNAGPMAMAGLLTPWITQLGRWSEKTASLIILFGLAALVCLALVALVWGWSVVLTRRARDIGWPAWMGVGGALLAYAMVWIVREAGAPAAAYLAGFGLQLGWMLVLGLPPSKGVARSAIDDAPDGAIA